MKDKDEQLFNAIENQLSYWKVREYQTPLRENLTEVLIMLGKMAEEEENKLKKERKK